MEINGKKTKFMIFNGSEVDKHPMTVNDVSVDMCEQYVCLGSTVTADGSNSTARAIMPMHRAMCPVLKFIAFVEKR